MTTLQRLDWMVVDAVLGELFSARFPSFREKNSDLIKTSIVGQAPAACTNSLRGLPSLKTQMLNREAIRE